MLLALNLCCENDWYAVIVENDCYCTVNIPPLITLEPLKDLQFRENEAIELPCAASGNPPPKFVYLLTYCLTKFYITQL